jgi:hypothetical protein
MLGEVGVGSIYTGWISASGKHKHRSFKPTQRYRSKPNSITHQGQAQRSSSSSSQPTPRASIPPQHGDIFVTNPTSPMTDSRTNPTNARALTPNLTQVSQDTATSNGPTGPIPNMSNRSQRARASSLDSFHLPPFAKSSTISTTSSCGTTTSKESAHIAAGSFSKPRVHPRSRRSTKSNESSARRYSGSGGEDFRYYGRHANQWLFNDFSVTSAVRKGWGRVFGGVSGEEGDWYEKRT